MSEHDRVDGTGSQRSAVDRGRKAGDRELVNGTGEFMGKARVDDVELGAGVEKHADDL